MSNNYDEYYQTENLFGKPYPELIQFYSSMNERGKLLDLGCGQGRDSIELAKLGFEVTGIDHSKVGIDQLNKIANLNGLTLIGLVADIYEYSDFGLFDYILLNSMFHFNKKDKATECAFIHKIIDGSKHNTLITICIQNKKEKIKTLESVLDSRADLENYDHKILDYVFEDKSSGHSSKTEYQMITYKKT